MYTWFKPEQKSSVTLHTNEPNEHVNVALYSVLPRFSKGQGAI